MRKLGLSGATWGSPEKCNYLSALQLCQRGVTLLPEGWKTRSRIINLQGVPSPSYNHPTSQVGAQPPAPHRTTPKPNPTSPLCPRTLRALLWLNPPLSGVQLSPPCPALPITTPQAPLPHEELQPLLGLPSVSAPGWTNSGSSAAHQTPCVPDPHLCGLR